MSTTTIGTRLPPAVERRRWIAASLIAVLALAGCQQTSRNPKAEEPPARVEAVPGSDFHRLTLSAKAAERLGIQTEKVVDGAPAGGSERIVPYAAVLYDANGLASAYTNPQLRTFVRKRITVNRVDGDRAILSDGPPLGTVVVTVGAAELFGLESGVGEA